MSSGPRQCRRCTVGLLFPSCETRSLLSPSVCLSVCFSDEAFFSICLFTNLCRSGVFAEPRSRHNWDSAFRVGGKTGIQVSVRRFPQTIFTCAAAGSGKRPCAPGRVAASAGLERILRPIVRTSETVDGNRRRSVATRLKSGGPPSRARRIWNFFWPRFFFDLPRRRLRRTLYYLHNLQTGPIS